MLNNPQDYDMELMSFLNKNEGKKEIDFINHQEKIRKELLEDITKKTDDDLRIEIENDFKTKGREIAPENVEYLLQVKKEKTNQIISRTKRELLSLNNYKERLNGFNFEEYDSLNSSDSSAVKKIIYLNELGIIDFLRTKTKVGISNGNLASALSEITGVKASTIKSSLNRLPKDHKIDNKHPYYTTKTVDNVKNHLIKLGF